MKQERFSLTDSLQLFRDAVPMHEYRSCDVCAINFIVVKQKEKRVGLIGKGKHDSNKKGEISESAIVTRFLQCGCVVLMPYGGNQR